MTIQTVREARTTITLHDREAEMYDEARNPNDRIHAIEQAVEMGAADGADWQEVSTDVLDFEEVHDEFEGPDDDAGG